MATLNYQPGGQGPVMPAPNPLETLLMVLTGQSQPPASAAPLMAPVVPRAPMPVAPPMTPTAAAPEETGVNPWAKAWDNYGKTWQDPTFATNYPFARGDQNSPAGNMAAGFGNALVNLPQNIWNIPSIWSGKPSTEVAVEGGKSILDWFTKPEGQINKEQNPTPETPEKAFKPGLPNLTSKITKVESGGNPTAKNPNSSAYGPGQFVKGTWLDFMRETMPEVLKAKGEKEALAMRSDPTLADQATAWYAGKGVDALDKVNAPATDTNLYLHHFLGPKGVQDLLSADPSAAVSSVLSKEQIAANKSVLGGATTVQDVIDWAALKMGEGIGAAPPPRPQQQMPDFTAMNEWFDKAAPQGVDPQMLKDQQFALLLEGIGAGLGSVDASRQGGGALFGALAKGTTSGVSAGKNLALQFDTQLKGDKAKYAGARAQFEGEKSELETSVANANAETEWMNASDEVKEKNTRAEFDRQKAAADKLAATPKILNASEKGLWIQNPGEQPTFLSNDTTSQWGQIEDMGKALGQDATQVRQAKYVQLAQSGNILMVEMEIAKDLLKDGLGPSVWGDAYNEAYAAASENLPESLTDPKSREEAIMKSLAGILMGASQEMDNYDWVTQAAAMGNPGAMMLVQNGTQPE